MAPEDPGGPSPRWHRETSSPLQDQGARVDSGWEVAASNGRTQDPPPGFPVRWGYPGSGPRVPAEGLGIPSVGSTRLRRLGGAEARGRLIGEAPRRIPGGWLAERIGGAPRALAAPPHSISASARLPTCAPADVRSSHNRWQVKGGLRPHPRGEASALASLHPHPPSKRTK